MQFRRIEIQRIMRHQELVDNPDEIRKILEAIQKNKLTFSVSIMGVFLAECSIIEIKEESVVLFNRGATWGSNQKRNVDFSEIMHLEVECNKDFVSIEDGGGRWAHLL